MVFYFKVLLTIITCTLLTLMWYASSATETSEGSPVLKGDVLELSLSGALSNQLNINDFKHIRCTNKEIVFLSNNVLPFDVEFSFQGIDLESQDWQYYSLDSTNPFKLDILELRKKDEIASFYALDGSFDLHKGEGYFDASMVNDQGQQLFLSGYFQC